MNEFCFITKKLLVRTKTCICSCNINGDGLKLKTNITEDCLFDKMSYDMQESVV